MEPPGLYLTAITLVTHSSITFVCAAVHECAMRCSCQRRYTSKIRFLRMKA